MIKKDKTEELSPEQRDRLSKLKLVLNEFEETSLIYGPASAEELKNRIIFLGGLPREQVIALRFAADVNLVPMGGFSLIEACASGKATVAYDVEWHGELITDEESGLLIPENDIDALTAGVERLLDEPELAKELGAQGRKTTQDLHDFKNVFSQRATVYKELLEE